jgi:hypothetical protein
MGDLNDKKVHRGATDNSVHGSSTFHLLRCPDASTPFHAGRALNGGRACCSEETRVQALP